MKEKKCQQKVLAAMIKNVVILLTSRLAIARQYLRIPFANASTRGILSKNVEKRIINWYKHGSNKKSHPIQIC